MARGPGFTGVGSVIPDASGCAGPGSLNVTVRLRFVEGGCGVWGRWCTDGLGVHSGVEGVSAMGMRFRSVVVSSSVPAGQVRGLGLSSGSGCPVIAGRSKSGAVVEGTDEIVVHFPAAAQVRITGTVSNINSLFGAVLPWQLKPGLASGEVANGATESVDTTWTNSGSARDVTVKFEDKALFGFEYAWDLALTWPGCGPGLLDLLDEDMLVGGDNPAMACLALCGAAGGPSVSDAAARLHGDPVDVVRGALVESVRDLSLPARGSWSSRWIRRVG